MNEQYLSKRLEHVGAYVPKNSRLADIGSDHAYLPVYLTLKNKLSFAIAGEVVNGPYESAKKQVQKSGLSEVIDVRLANGLHAIELSDQIDTVTICGMGGTLIREILDEGMSTQKLTGFERLILQPNIGEKTLRNWLMKHGYAIIFEEILEEKNKIYEIIVAERKKMAVSYTDTELLLGPILMKEKSEIFQKKWQRELKQRETILEQLNHSVDTHQEKRKKLLIEIQQIKEVL